MTEKEIDPLKDYKGFFEELQSETPRAAVILACAFLDAQLRELLSKFLIKDKKEVKKLIGSNGPLSTFYSRISAAYCLGLISQMEYEDLNDIREIRNKFAHKMHGYSFDEPEIVSSCKKLRLAKMILESSTFSKYTHGDMFLLCVTQLSLWLAMKTLRVENDRRSVPPDQKMGQLIREEK